MRTKVLPIALLCTACLCLPVLAQTQNPHLVVYEGQAGPGQGKHIVFLAGDHDQPAIRRAAPLNTSDRSLVHRDSLVLVWGGGFSPRPTWQPK